MNNMNKLKNIFIIALASLVMLSHSGCFGSFQLTKMVHELNQDISSDKFIQEVVFIFLFILPAYEAAFICDVLVMNLIEFWTGANPVAMNEGDVEIKYIQKGDEIFQFTATKNKMNVKQIAGKKAGEEFSVIYDPQNASCYLDYNNQLTKMADIKVGYKTDITYYLPNNKSIKHRI